MAPEGALLGDKRTKRMSGRSKTNKHFLTCSPNLHPSPRQCCRIMQWGDAHGGCVQLEDVRNPSPQKQPVKTFFLEDTAGRDSSAEGPKSWQMNSFMHAYINAFMHSYINLSLLSSYRVPCILGIKRWMRYSPSLPPPASPSWVILPQAPVSA